MFYSSIAEQVLEHDGRDKNESTHYALCDKGKGKYLSGQIIQESLGTCMIKRSSADVVVSRLT